MNYRFQRSERNIGKAIGELVAAGEIAREQVVVATKGGYITFDGEVPANPRAWFEEHYVKTGIVAPADLVDGSHCMTPKYIGTMLELSRKNLNLETIDIYYIHNPETQLEAIERKEFLARIATIFEFLETAVESGKIGVYGTATWNGFRAAPTERGWLSLDELMKIAREVAGDAHHFRAIQLPYNLAMPEAVTRSNQFVHAGKATALAAAKAVRPRGLRERVVAAGAVIARAAADRRECVRRLRDRRAKIDSVRALDAGRGRGAGRDEVGRSRSRHAGDGAQAAGDGRGVDAIVPTG